MYSFSGLSTTLPDKYGCWYKFYCRYVLKLPSSPGLPLIFGKACHSVIETAIKAKNTEIIPMLVDVAAGSNDLDDEKETMLKCVNTNAVHAAIKTGGEVEEYFQFPLDDSPFAPSLRGFIDFKQKNGKAVVITDWKTNRSTYHPTETYQLALYAAAMKKKHSLPVVGRLAFLRFNQVIEHEYTDTEINESLEWARDTAYECEARKQRIKMGHDPLEVFPKSPGNCEWCDYKHFCLAPKTEILEAILTLEDAQKIAEGIMFIKEKIKLHEGRLKNYINTQGPVETARCKAKINISEYFLFNLKARKAVVEEMQKQKLNIGSILKIGSDAQKDLIKKHGWTEQTFIDLGATKGKTTRLSINKK